MINCGLSSTTVEKLYKSVYKHMLEASNKKEAFNPINYIAYVYGNKAQASTPENAAKIVQHIPRIIIDIYNTDFIQTPEFNLDLNELSRLGKKFLNEETGINNIINEYKEKSLAFLRKIANSKKSEKDDVVQVDPEIEPVKVTTDSYRFKPYSAFTGTSQEFLAVNPTEINIEKVDESKQHIYSVINKIKELPIPLQTQTSLEDLMYDGVPIMIKVTKLNSLDQNDLDQYTKDLIVRSRSIQKGKKQVEGVTPADDINVIVITDSQGAVQYFDDNGNITTKENGGKPVYQFLRDVRKTGKEFTVTNIYGYSSILSPEEIALSIYGDKNITPELIEQAREWQQEEFKELYDLQNKVRGGEEVLMPITGVSEGILGSYVGKKIALKDISTLADVDKSVYKSISTVEKDRGLFKKGYATIKINGAELLIDRVGISPDIAKEIAHVVTSKNLPFNVRVAFYNQFLNNSVSQQARRHYTTTKFDNESFVFFYSNDTYQQNSKRNLSQNSIDLSQKAIESKTQEELNIDAEAIMNVLNSGWSRKSGGTFPTKMTYSSKNLESGSYYRANIVPNNPAALDLTQEDYIDFIKTLPAEVTLAVTDKDIFNNYIYFGSNTETQDQVNKAKEQTELENNIKGPIRTMKDNLVEMIKKDGVLDTSVVSTKSGVYKGKPFANFQIAIPGVEETAKVYFTNKTPKDDPNWPVQYDSVRLEVRPTLNVDGKVYTDVIEVYKIYEDGQRGPYLGVIAERDVSEYANAVIPEEAEEVNDEKVIEATEQKVDPEIDAQVRINPPTDPSNSNSLFSQDWKGLDRSNETGKFMDILKLNTDAVTRKQIKEAKEWWKNSPLSTYIELEHMYNIFASDSFAKFLVSGDLIYNTINGELTPTKGAGSYAKIQINKSLFGKGGTMVDVYHEAWHAFTQLFLTKEEKQKLYDEVKDYLWKNAKDTRDVNITYKEIEELLAEEFRTYAKNPIKYKETPLPKTRSIFRKILDFLVKFFSMSAGKRGKVDVEYYYEPILLTDYPPIVSEMFNKLYFGKAENLTFGPNINNVEWDMLNRGIERVDSKKDDALSRQDSILISESIDSIISETIDALNLNFGTKSATTKALTDPHNNAIFYNQVKQVLENRLKDLQKDLGPITNTNFNSLSTIEDLEREAAAVIRSSKGDHKYVFLNSQVDEFTKLNPDTKGGQRIKGHDYHGIKIIADFYEHKDIKSDKDGADIIVVKDLRDAELQYKYYKEGGGTSFQSLEIKEDIQYKELNIAQQQILNNIRILQTALDNWGDDTKGVIKYHKENSIFDIVKESYTDEEIVEFDEEGNPVDESSPENEYNIKNGEVGKKSLDQIAQKEVLYILKSLHKISDGKTVDNKLGFKQLADFGKMWRIVTREIGTEKDPKIIYEKLVKASKTIPELKQLVEDKIPNPSNIKRVEEFKIFNSFWQTFSRPRVSYLQMTAWPEKAMDPYTEKETITGFTVEVVNASIDASNIIRKFRSQFAALTEKDNKYITRIDNIPSLTKLDKLVDNFKNKYSPKELDIKKSVEFARSIGIFLEKSKAVEAILTEESEDYGLPYLFNIVYDLAQIQKKGTGASAQEKVLLAAFIKDPLTVMQSKIDASLLPSFKGTEVYQRNIIKKLADLQGRYGLDTSNYSVLNPEKNLVNEFIDEHSISRMVDAVNKVEKLSDLWTKDEFKYMRHFSPKINTFTERSIVLKSLFNTKGNKIKKRDLELFIDAGTQVAEMGADVGTVTTNLDIYSKFLQEVHTMLKSGVQEFIRHASKKSSFGVKVNGGIFEYLGKGKDSNLYVDVNFFSPNKVGIGRKMAVDNILLGHLASEFERVVKFKKNKNLFKKYEGYNKVVDVIDGEDILAGEVFTAFDNVLTESTKKQLLDPEFIDKFVNAETTFEKFISTDPTLKENIKTDMINYFREQTVENIGIFNSFSADHTIKGGKGAFIDKALFDQLDNASNLTKDEKVDALLEAYTYNAWIHNFETINLFYGDMAQFNHLKEEMHKRNTGSTSGGPKFRSDLDAQNFVNNILNAEGNTYASKYAKRVNKPEYNNFTNYNGTLNTAVGEDPVRESIYLDNIEAALRKDYESRGWSKEKVDRVLNEDLDTYKKMTEADGAGYITIDAYRTLKNLENAWSPEQEALYQKIINNNPISAADVVNFFPTYKLQYFGALAVEGKDGEILGDQLPVTAMHKFALQPLIPSVIKGTELEHLHHEMLRNNIQYYTFVSGSKVSTITNNGKLDNIFIDDTQKILKDKLEFTPNTIHTEYLKVAAAVNTKYKGKVMYPSQMRGLILDGLYNNGKLINEKNKDIADAYHNVVSQYSATLKADLLNSIGFEEKDGKYYGQLSKFLDLVQRELGTKDMPDHLIRMIGVNGDGTVKTDLSLHLEADTIEKMLLSLLTKKLIKQKVNGEALVQVPSTMYNGLWDNKVKFDKASLEQEKKYLGTNNLPFYHPGKDGKTKAMKIAIALQGDFVNLLKREYNGKEIGDLATLNQAIKDDKWLDEGNNRKAITLAGARIPIQNLNSMEFAEVYEFLDPSAGNMVIVPTEIVAKAGSDFDVDKIFWTMPNLDREGVYLDGVMSKAEFEKALATPEKDLGMSHSKLIAKQKKALENELLSLTAGILSLPDNYVSLIRPNHTYLVKDFADEYEQYMTSYDRFKNMHEEGMRQGPPDKKGKRKKAISPTRVLEAGYNIYKHDVNMVGKDTLGIEALQNKKHPIFKSIGAMMPATYESQEHDGNRYYDTGRVYDMRLLLPHNKVKDSNGVERISLASNYNTENDRVADIYSHVMNGLLDVEKDAWVFYIQANLETINVLNYLLEAGVPAETAILFVSQPLIREYALNQKMMKSTFSTLSLNEVIPFTFVKSKAAQKVVAKYVPITKANEIFADINTKNFNEALDTIGDDEIINIEHANKKFSFDVKGAGFKRAAARGEVTFTNVKKITKAGSDKLFYNRIGKLTSNDAFYDVANYLSKVPGVLDKSGNFDKAKLKETLMNPNENMDLQLATFLHFIELEKQIKGLDSVKKQSNPDTNVLKTVQQIKKKENMFVDSLESSKIDPDLPLKLKNESILSSFYLSNMAIDIMKPALSLRLNDKISDFISNKLSNNTKDISARFGVGQESEERFATAYNNAVVNYVFQNYMSNFLDAEGNVIDIPQSYRKTEVIKKPGVKNGVEYIDGKIYVDEKRLKKEFNNKSYLKSAHPKDPYRYEATDKAAFVPNDDLFPNQSTYNKYVFEREYLRSRYVTEAKTPEDILKYEKYLNQRALINSFNKDAINGSYEYSYTDLVIRTIKEFEHLKDTYPILDQLSVLPNVGKDKIIQLNDREFAKGDLAEVYYQNLRELGDINIRKIFPTEDTDEARAEADEKNRRLSDVFRVFSLMMIHQHGAGYSKYGFNKVLDDADYISVMRYASAAFENNFDKYKLQEIYNNVISDSRFKNYTIPSAELAKKKLEVQKRNNGDAITLDTFVDNLVLEMGEETFNQKIKDTYPGLYITDIPENATVDNVENEVYDEIVPFEYKSFKTIINRLIKLGVDIKNSDAIFYNDTTEEALKLDEIYSIIESIDTPEEEFTTDESVETPVEGEQNMTDKEKDDISADRNDGEYPTIMYFYSTLTENQKKIFGSAENIVQKYVEGFAAFYTEEEFVDHLKNCF